MTQGQKQELTRLNERYMRVGLDAGEQARLRKLEGIRLGELTAHKDQLTTHFNRQRTLCP